MFEDSLFATNPRPARRRGWTTALSFGIQAAMLTVLVMLPLYYTDALPMGALKNYVELPLPPPGPHASAPPEQGNRSRPQTTSEFRDNVLLLPTHIPDQIIQIVEDRTPAPSGPYVPGSTGSGEVGDRNPITDILLASNMRVAPPPPPVHHETRRLIISHLDEGMLIRRVEPLYPRMAVQIRQQGTVTLQATIGRDGTIQNLHALSGPPLLIGSAIDAVRQWRYRPYLLNNEPVEVETQITVHFTLN